MPKYYVFGGTQTSFSRIIRFIKWCTFYYFYRINDVLYYLPFSFLKLTIFRNLFCIFAVPIRIPQDEIWLENIWAVRVSVLLIVLIAEYCNNVRYIKTWYHTFSSSEPKAQDELFWSLHRCPSSVRRPFRLSNDFSSETSGPIFIKLHVEPSVKRGLKIYTNGHGLFIKMVAMPIYGKNIQKSSSLEPRKLHGWMLYIASWTQGLPGLFK